MEENNKEKGEREKRKRQGGKDKRIKIRQQSAALFSIESYLNCSQKVSFS